MHEVSAGGVVSGEALLASAIRFAGDLRSAGLRPGLRGVADFVRALDLVGMADRGTVRAAGAALLVHHRDELPPYEEAFDRFWRRSRPSAEHERPEPSQAGRDAAPPTGRPAPASPGPARSAERPRAHPASLVEPSNPADESDAVDPGGRRTWSASEALRHREFERMTPLELREAERAIDRLLPTLERRRTRRFELHPHGRLLAPRPMLRRSLTTGGELVSWVWRRPIRRPRPIAVLCDISGSMELHARLLLRFTQALARADRRTEAFVFGTRLTRISRQLRRRDPDEALRRVASEVVDWSGGTRIGESFRAFNRRWAGRVVSTSAVLIVVSDGWDRGDPAQVGAETARLRRNCHRLVWLNPLAAAPGYQPLAAGMAAALPHVDHFLPCGNLEGLERLCELLGSLQDLPSAVSEPAPAPLVA